MTDERQTNIEFVTHMMNFSQYGAMSQLFILNAIDKMSAATAECDLAQLKEEMGNGMVNAEAWHGVAKEIQEKLRKHYGD